MAVNKVLGIGSELHLFIIWEFARNLEERIIKDIAQDYDIHRVFEVHWSKKHFAKNLTRFYGVNLPPNSFKEKHVGKGPFLLVVVKDKKSKYAKHETSKGVQKVNTRLFMSKTKHREWTGGGHKIHATNSPIETNHDLTLLLGLNTSDFLNKYPKPEPQKIEVLKQDLVGTEGWFSLGQLFYVLNNTLKYVVLRNFDPLPENYYADKHGDIDFLVENLFEAETIMNAKKVFKEDFRVHYKISVAEDEVYMDLRFLGDEYYLKSWESKILSSRVLSNGGFYVPSKKIHLYTLIYHALVHKSQIAPDYLDKFAELDSGLARASKEKLSRELARYMRKNQYICTRPIDISVMYNAENAQTINDMMVSHRTVPGKAKSYLKKRLRKVAKRR